MKRKRGKELNGVPTVSDYWRPIAQKSRRSFKPRKGQISNTTRSLITLLVLRRGEAPLSREPSKRGRCGNGSNVRLRWQDARGYGAGGDGARRAGRGPGAAAARAGRAAGRARAGGAAAAAALGGAGPRAGPVQRRGRGRGRAGAGRVAAPGAGRTRRARGAAADAGHGVPASPRRRARRRAAP